MIRNVKITPKNTEKNIYKIQYSLYLKGGFARTTAAMKYFNCSKKNFKYVEY